MVRLCHRPSGKSKHWLQIGKGVSVDDLKGHKLSLFCFVSESTCVYLGLSLFGNSFIFNSDNSKLFAAKALWNYAAHSYRIFLS